MARLSALHRIEEEADRILHQNSIGDTTTEAIEIGQRLLGAPALWQARGQRKELRHINLPNHLADTLDQITAL